MNNNIDEPKLEPFEEPSPEDFLPAPKKPPSALEIGPAIEHMLFPFVLYAFFWVFSLAYWRSGYRDLLPVSNEGIFAKHEYWRAKTALFTHADVPHLLANSPLFLIFGWFLAAYFGLWVFPVLTLLIGVLTNVITVYFMPETSRLVGASGMLYGMVSLWILLYMRFDSRYGVGTRILRGIAVSLILLFPTTFVANVSYLAHGVGFVVGLALGLLILPFVKVYET
jgi:membrane associated rhomboid family serine protease